MATHLVLYDKTTGYVHGIFDLAVVGAVQNAGTWEADDEIECATGVIARGFSGVASNLGVWEATDPTYDDADFPGYGVFEVDNAVTPTDLQERTDAGRDEEQDDYIFTE